MKQVKVDVILIESDMVAKAILELIPVLDITKLVVGTAKSNSRLGCTSFSFCLSHLQLRFQSSEFGKWLFLPVGVRRSRSKRGNGIADQILQNAPEICDVKIICEGKEVILDRLAVESPSPPMHSKPTTPSQWNIDGPKPMQEGNQCVDYFACICFKPKAA